MSDNMYWDKLAGVLVELSMEESEQTGTYATNQSEHIQIIDSNVWTVPESPLGHQHCLY
jgi:hypothetical protein